MIDNTIVPATEGNANETNQTEVLTAQKPEGSKGNKSGKKTVTAQIETVVIETPTGTGEANATTKKPFSIDLNDVCGSIGTMLKELPYKFSFKLLGQTFSVPAISATNTNGERAAAIFKQMATKFFPADQPASYEIADGKEKTAILSLKAAGFKFSTCCKIEVLQSVQIKLNLWRSRNKLHKEVVNKLNSKEVAETKVNRETVKGMKIALGIELTKHTTAFTVRNGRLIAAAN